MFGVHGGNRTTAIGDAWVTRIPLVDLAGGCVDLPGTVSIGLGFDLAGGSEPEGVDPGAGHGHQSVGWNAS